VWVLLLIVSFGKFFANWLAFFMGNTQHCGLRRSAPDFRKNTRSITLDPVTEFLFWRMNWHIEHHMFAAVPCYNLKALHNEVAHDMPVPRTLIGAWKEMRETWFKQQVDPGYEFDTPLPSSANAMGGETVRVAEGKISTARTLDTENTDETSFGDLDPMEELARRLKIRPGAKSPATTPRTIDGFKVERGVRAKTGEVLGYASRPVLTSRFPRTYNSNGTGNSSSSSSSSSDSDDEDVGLD